MRVQVNTDKLSASSTGNLVGAVWIDGDGFSFPSNGWSDFVALVLEQWASEIRAISGRDGVARLRVFDGPDTLRIERAGDLLLLRICHPSEMDKELQSTASAVTALCESGRECCDQLLSLARFMTEDDRVRLEAAQGCFFPETW